MLAVETVLTAEIRNPAFGGNTGAAEEYDPTAFVDHF